VTAHPLQLVGCGSGTAGALADGLLSRPHAGRPGLAGVDGRSGAGKTLLTGALDRELRRRGATTTVVHMDDLYAGWNGLVSSLPVLRDQVLKPLRAGRAGCFRQWDWHRGAPGAVTGVPASSVVLVEGVGALAAWPGAYDLRVWVQAPAEVRHRNAVARDGTDTRRHWDDWAAQEDVVFGEDRSAGPPWRVDAVVCVVGTAASRSRPGAVPTSAPDGDRG
jgi:hypothetical protein